MTEPYVTADGYKVSQKSIVISGNSALCNAQTIGEDARTTAGPVMNSLEVIASELIENALRPIMEKLQVFEKKLSQIDVAISDLKTEVGDLRKAVSVICKILLAQAVYACMHELY